MSVRFSIALSGACLAILCGCAQSPDTIAYANRMHSQILAEETTADLKIGTFLAGDKLGVLERQAVKQFTASYQREGHGAVVISRPSNGPDDVSAMRAAADARAVMLAEGVDATQIAEGTYDGTGAKSAPLILTYRTYNAVVPNCPDIAHWDLAYTGSNTSLPSLGCAVNVNLAAQLADASDLVGNQPMDAADSDRRSVVFTKYRAGEKTSAEKNADATGTISRAVN